MKKFTFKYTKVLWLLTIALLLIALAGLAFNIYYLVQFWSAGISNLISYFLLILINLTLLVFCGGLMFFRNYTISKEHLFTRFGILKFKVKLLDITEVIIYENLKKLVVYFADAKYTVIIIDQADFDKFASALKENNPAIFITKKSQD